MERKTKTKSRGLKVKEEKLERWDHVRHALLTLPGQMAGTVKGIRHNYQKLLRYTYRFVQALATAETEYREDLLAMCEEDKMEIVPFIDQQWRLVESVVGDVQTAKKAIVGGMTEREFVEESSPAMFVLKQLAENTKRATQKGERKMFARIHAREPEKGEELTTVQERDRWKACCQKLQAEVDELRGRLRQIMRAIGRVEAENRGLKKMVRGAA